MSRKRINYVQWVTKTISKMNEYQQEDFEYWRNYWEDNEEIKKNNTHETLIKRCPKYAAYGLWYLGYIADSGRKFQNWTIEDMKFRDIRSNKKLGRKKVLGKNAVYAVLALRILKNCQGNINHRDLWLKVKENYLQLCMGDKIATGDQGAARMAMQLFEARKVNLYFID
jgi:hypothetical protein